MTKKSRVRKVIVTLGGVALLFVLCALTGVGCVSVVNLEYRRHVQQLDEKNELVISTHPAWFPTEEVKVPLLYMKLVTDDYVALQFHVREHGTAFGSSPHIESIQVHKLAYRLDDGPENVVLRDFSGGFWMHETGNHSERTKKAIPYRKGSVLHATVDLTLNGENHSIECEMPARQRVSRYPIFIYYLGR
jgi:hypothetical protein